MPDLPLLPIQIYADYLRFGQLPVDLWSLPSDVADELRHIDSVVEAKRQQDQG